VQRLEFDRRWFLREKAMYKVVSVFVMVALVVGCLLVAGCPSQTRMGPAVSDQQIRHGTWNVRADIPEPRFGGAAAVVGHNCTCSAA
jgi:hypothetical protein